MLKDNLRSHYCKDAMNTPTEDVTDLVKETQQQFDRKDFAAALIGYDQIRRADPKNAFYFDRFGFCFIALKRWSEAEAVWLEIIRNHGASKGRINYVLQCHLETQRYAEAIAFARQYDDLCGSDPTSLTYIATAALGCGSLPEAIRAFEGLEAACASAKLPAFHAQLGYRLLVLARHGDADIAIAFLDHILPSIADPVPLLDAGARLAGAGKRWLSQLRYLERLIALDSTVIGRYLDKASALLALGEGHQCRELLADFAARFPPALRGAGADQRLQGLEIRANSMSIWQVKLTEARTTTTFQGLTFRAEAHSALNQHHQAMDVALSALALYDNHTWFQFLIGKYHDAVGENEKALDWMTRATAAENPPTQYLLGLLRAAIKAGDPEAAARTTARLRRRHPSSSFIASVLDSLGVAAGENTVEPGSHVADVQSSPMTWLHGGDSGDVIYSLAAVQAAGGGHFYLTCIDATREPMDSQKIDFLMPLIGAQSYVLSVAAWHGEPISKDLNVMRNMMLPELDLATMHWRAVMDSGELDLRMPWLTAPMSQRHGRPVFARSSRYRNPRWDPFWEELKVASPDAIFVGTTAEFDDFRHGEHYLARDALDLAQIIQGASTFVGNQSFPYAIAEGLKIGRVLEVSPYVKNCLFPGALAIGFETAESRT